MLLRPWWEFTKQCRKPKWLVPTIRMNFRAGVLESEKMNVKESAQNNIWASPATRSVCGLLVNFLYQNGQYLLKAWKLGISNPRSFSKDHVKIKSRKQVNNNKQIHVLERDSRGIYCCVTLLLITSIHCFLICGPLPSWLKRKHRSTTNGCSLQS